MSTATTTSRHTHPAVGDRFIGGYGIVRVMAIAEGWVMMFPQSSCSCPPFCVETKELMALKHWQLQCDICNPQGKTQPAPPASTES